MPMGIAVNSQGDIFVTDLEWGKVMRIDVKKKTAIEVAKVPAPVGICVGPNDHLWVVSRSAQGQIVRIHTDGSVHRPVTGRPFKFPHNVTVSENGTLRVVDGYSRKIWKVVAGNAPVEWVTNDAFRNPVDIKAYGAAWLVVDPRAQAMFKIDADGKSTATALPTSY
jgi:sugar lactone lactonase YvrE